MAAPPHEPEAAVAATRGRWLNGQPGWHEEAARTDQEAGDGRHDFGAAPVRKSNNALRYLGGGLGGQQGVRTDVSARRRHDDVVLIGRRCSRLGVFVGCNVKEKKKPKM